MKTLEHVNEKSRGQPWPLEWSQYLRLGRENKKFMKVYTMNGQREPVVCVVGEDKEINLENLENRDLIEHRCAAI